MNQHSKRPPNYRHEFVPNTPQRVRGHCVAKQKEHVFTGRIWRMLRVSNSRWNTLAILQTRDKGI